VILFPAIDLKDGRCVRLKRGAMESATVFNDDPAAQALTFERAGFSWLHCVDLDGAFAGRSANAEASASGPTAIFACGDAHQAIAWLLRTAPLSARWRRAATVESSTSPRLPASNERRVSVTTSRVVDSSDIARPVSRPGDTGLETYAAIM